MRGAYLLDLLIEKGQFITSYYLGLTGITDHAIVIRHEADKTKKIVSDFILGLQP